MNNLWRIVQLMGVIIFIIGASGSKILGRSYFKFMKEHGNKNNLGVIGYYPMFFTFLMIGLGMIVIGTLLMAR
ncbi:hypothetical protein [Clostridium formicaceticum]|uniref:Uncharacterized protein n=1 Tax=Clostridium formicaceticum TaxID=1497 RepID=A0AAC9RHT8_9CLOT|nr:hypothetical protein [Clostridium formicaceticum]AOY76795.1 hypothetical protein BJL90_13595 [Clostridium formicaceticum]ARE87259.1 hypothetical protein CLFO_16580 [Clostridium formicaceticum]